jgi:hypothetical protein
VSPTLAAWIADDGFLDEGTLPPGVERGPLDAEQELAHVLAWAVHTGVVPAADVDLLVRLEFADVDHRRAVARTRGVHERTLRRECNRIKARLHEANRLARQTIAPRQRPSACLFFLLRSASSSAAGGFACHPMRYR